METRSHAHTTGTRAAEPMLATAAVQETEEIVELEDADIIEVGPPPPPPWVRSRFLA